MWTCNAKNLHVPYRSTPIVYWQLLNRHDYVIICLIHKDCLNNAILFDDYKNGKALKQFKLQKMSWLKHNKNRNEMDVCH